MTAQQAIERLTSAAGRGESTPGSDTDVCLVLADASRPRVALSQKKLDYLVVGDLDVQVFQQVPRYVRLVHKYGGVDDEIVFATVRTRRPRLRAVQAGSSRFARLAHVAILLIATHPMKRLKPIRTKTDHAVAMAEIKRLWSAKLGTPEGDRLDILATLVDVYETQRYPMNPPDPIEAIKFRMEHSRAEVLNQRRGLSIHMIRRLHDTLGISADVLIRPSRVRKGSRVGGRRSLARGSCDTLAPCDRKTLLDLPAEIGRR